jgi:hypothetical protein
VVTAPNAPGPDLRPSGLRVAAIGCFMAVIGFFSGGMIGVLLSKIVAFFTKAPACDGIPTCNWYIYMGVGGVIGALSLPWLVVGALRSAPPAPASNNTDDKN